MAKYKISFEAEIPTGDVAQIEMEATIALSNLAGTLFEPLDDSIRVEKEGQKEAIFKAILDRQSEMVCSPLRGSHVSVEDIKKVFGEFGVKEEIKF